MCGLEVGCRCVFSNTRGGGRGGREGREEKPEQNWECDRQTWSLPSTIQVQDRAVRKHFLFVTFFLPWKHKRERERDYIYRPVLIYTHCSDDHNEGLFKTWPLFGSRCFPQLIMMLGCTVYMCVFFFLCTQCVCVCVCVNESQRVHHALCCALFHPSLYMTQTLPFPAVFMHPLPLDRNKHSLIRREHTRAQTHAYRNIQAIYIMNTDP